MGACQTKNLTSKCSSGEENERIKYAASCMQGLRREMQDAHAAILDLDGSGSTSFFGVYDGHRGAQVALYCSRQFHVELANDPDYDNNLRNAVEHVYFRIDENLQESDEWRELAYPPGKGKFIRCLRTDACFANLLPWKAPYIGPLNEGTTACVAVIRGNQIIVGNAGDSRCVLSRNGQAISLSTDHKPYQQHERERIEAAGGEVRRDAFAKVLPGRVRRTEFGRTVFGLYRINGKITKSRAIGHFEYKQNTALLPAEQMVTCNPGIHTVDITNDTEFLLIASDGVWDVMTNQQAVDFVRGCLTMGITDLRVICESLLDSCVGSDDNATVILVQLNELAQGQSSSSSSSASEADQSSDIVQVQSSSAAAVNVQGQSSRAATISESSDEIVEVGREETSLL